MESKGKAEKASLVSSPNSKSTLCHPSKLAFKAYFLFFYAAVGSSFPYLMLFFKQLGMSAAKAGILSGVKLFSEFIGGPFWGTVADKFRIRKIILFASLVSFSSGILLFMPFPPRNQECIETRANGTVIKTPLSFTTGEIRYDKSHEDEEQSVEDGGFLNHTGHSNFTRRIDETEISQIFTTFLVITISSQIVGSVVFNMPDALVAGFLQEGISTFGYYRVWGEVGVAIGSFVVGGVINFYQWEVCGEIVKNYFVLFYFFSGFISLAMFTLIFLKATYPDEDTNDSNLWLLVKELMRFHNAMFVVVACFLGILVGLNEFFGLWYLDDLGAEPYMLGLASGLRYTVATCGYTLSRIVIDKFGHTCTIAVCLLLYIVDYMSMSFVRNPWLGVALFSAQGFLYGTSWSACVVFGGTVSLRVGFYSATQGVLGGVYWGLGVGTGVLLSGVLINWLGVAKTYFVYSVVTFIVLVPFSLANFWIRSKDERGNSDQEYNLLAKETEENH